MKKLIQAFILNNTLYPKRLFVLSLMHLKVGIPTIFHVDSIVEYGIKLSKRKHLKRISFNRDIVKFLLSNFGDSYDLSKQSELIDINNTLKMMMHVPFFTRISVFMKLQDTMQGK